MNLFVKIPKGNLDDYRKEFIECLKHNSTNSNIKGIFVYTDQIDHKIEPIYKTKVFFKRKLPSDIEMISYSKSTRENKIIYSDPFVKFEEDLYKVTDEELDNFVIKGQNYFIFSKKTNLILTGPTELKFEKIEKNTQLKTNTIGVTRVDSLVEKNSNILIKKSVYTQPQTISTKRLKKLDVVIVSVNYNDYLTISLKHNTQIFQNITVVTSPDDKLCIDICERYGVKCLVTDIMYENGDSFNKGKAINHGIKSILDPDLILLLDADIIVEKEIDLDSLSDQVIYTSQRISLLNYNTYKNYLKYGINSKLKVENDKGYGFFQLFCINNEILNKENPFPEDSSDASWSDLKFRDKFLFKQSISNRCLHLGESFRNWKGRITEDFLTKDELNIEIDDINKFNNKVLKNSNRSKDIKPKLAVLTTFFNPMNYINIKYNYKKFSEKLNCDLFTIELSFDGNFYLEGENVIRVNGDKKNILWQKERLLNILLEQIPKEYTNIAWVDCDILFNNQKWVEETNTMLQKYRVVQLYEFANRLNEHGDIELKSKGIIKRIDEINNIDLNLSLGIPGFAWAIRREIIEELKFLDTQIIGGGDSLMCYSFLGEKNGFVSEKMNSEWFNCFSEWSDKAINLIDKSVGYVRGEITHLYHGKMINRKYNDRYLILSENKFNPKKDLEIDNNQLWKFKNRILSNKLLGYFGNRNEDDNILEINKYFDKVFVLNLDRRKDRLEKISEKLNRLEIKFERFSAVDGDNLDFTPNDINKPGLGLIENKYALACLLSHLEIVKESKRRGYKRILIFEDDVLISKEIKVIFQELREIKDWKLLYLGSSQYNWDVEFYNDEFYFSKKTLGTFAYAIDESIYDDIIETLEQKSKSVDNLLAELQSKHYGHCFTFYPNICSCDVSESEIRESRDNIEHSKKMRWTLTNYV